MVVRMRATKSHRNNRRSHHKLANPALGVCDSCNAPHIRHRMCISCGMYRGKQIAKKTTQAPTVTKKPEKSPEVKKKVAKKKAPTKKA